MVHNVKQELWHGCSWILYASVSLILKAPTRVFDKPQGRRSVHTIVFIIMLGLDYCLLGSRWIIDVWDEMGKMYLSLYSDWLICLVALNWKCISISSLSQSITFGSQINVLFPSLEMSMWEERRLFYVFSLLTYYEKLLFCIFCSIYFSFAFMFLISALMRRNTTTRAPSSAYWRPIKGSSMSTGLGCKPITLRKTLRVQS